MPNVLCLILNLPLGSHGGARVWMQVNFSLISIMASVASGYSSSGMAPSSLRSISI